MLMQLFAQAAVSVLLIPLALPVYVVNMLYLKRLEVRRAWLGSMRNCKDSFFITGASSGIGAALAVRLAARPQTASVFLCGRSWNRLEETRLACRSVAKNTSLRLRCIQVEVTDAKAMKQAILDADCEAADHNGIGLTSVIANAGVSQEGCGVSAGSNPFETSAAIVNINMCGTCNTVAPIIPLLIKRRTGQVVIISSVAAYISSTTILTAYGASKSAQRVYGENLKGTFHRGCVGILEASPVLQAQS